MAVIRDNKGRFAPGSRGGGRKGMHPEVRRLLTEACPEAVQTVIGIMRDKEAPPRVRVECAQTIIERVYGKAVQPMELSGPEGDPIKIATEQDAAKALELLGYVRK